MVVGIYNLPDVASPKRRWSEGSASASGRSPKRCREEAPVDTLEPLPPAVVLLEENGGIWHVDGLLELLAGALCATLGADPASLAMACATTDGPTEGRANHAECSTSGDNSAIHKHQQLDDSRQQCPQHLAGHEQEHDGSIAPAAGPALTENLLKAHTAISGGQLQTGSKQMSSAAGEEDDRLSVVSLSAWVADSQFSGHRCSGGGAQPAQDGRTSIAAVSAASDSSSFSFFSVAASASRASSSGGGSSSSIGDDGGFSFRGVGRIAATGGVRCGAKAHGEPCWPRRRLYALGCWR